MLREDLPVAVDPHRAVDDNAKTLVERREAVNEADAEDDTHAAVLQGAAAPQR